MDQFLSLFRQYDVLGAFWANLQLTFWGAIGAFILGTLLALMRISPVPSLRWLGTGYVHLLRNTPLTILMAVAVLGFWTQLKITLSDDFNRNFFAWAVVMLVVYHAAFVCEAIRSGVTDLGSTTMSFWRSQRSATWAGVFPRESATWPRTSLSSTLPEPSGLQASTTRPLAAA